MREIHLIFSPAIWVAIVFVPALPACSISRAAPVDRALSALFVPRVHLGVALGERSVAAVGAAPFFEAYVSASWPLGSPRPVVPLASWDVAP